MGQDGGTSPRFYSRKEYWAGLVARDHPTPCSCGPLLYKRQLPSQEISRSFRARMEGGVEGQKLGLTHAGK